MPAKTNTKVSRKFRILLPVKIREKFGVRPGDEIVWTLIGDEILVRIRKQGNRDPLAKLIGAFPTKTKTDGTREMDSVVYRQR